MRVSRGPSRNTWSVDGWEITDSKAPSRYIEAFKQGLGDRYYGFDGGAIKLKGTKKPNAQRIGMLKFELSNDDVCALFNAMLERKAEDEQRFLQALRRIDELLNPPPNFDELLAQPPKRTHEESLASDRELLEQIRKEVVCALDPDGWSRSYGKSTAQTGRSDAADWNPFRVEPSPAKRDRKKKARVSTLGRRGG